MEPIFQKEFQVTDICVDRFGRLKPSAMLIYAQELAANTFNTLISKVTCIA